MRWFETRRFGITYRSHFQGSRCPFWTSWLLIMGLLGGLETSISNHLTPRNNLEDGRIQLNRGGSLRSRKFYSTLRMSINSGSIHSDRNEFFRAWQQSGKAPYYTIWNVPHDTKKRVSSTMFTFIRVAVNQSQNHEQRVSLQWISQTSWDGTQISSTSSYTQLVILILYLFEDVPERRGYTTSSSKVIVVCVFYDAVSI